MFGFLFGFFCLWGLIRVIRHGRGYGYGSRCGGYDREDWGHDGGSHRRGRWGGRRRGGWRSPRSMFMHRLFEELDTTPGQEKEIRAAIDDVMGAAESVKDGMHDVRRDVGAVFRNDELDETIMADILGKQDDAVDKIREATASGLARIHAALDPEQRARLARWLERGPRWNRRGWGGPYRAHA